MPHKQKLELAIDQAVYLVEVRGKPMPFTATVVTDINAFDQAARLGCDAVALDAGFSVDELWASRVEMLTHPLVIQI